MFFRNTLRVLIGCALVLALTATVYAQTCQTCPTYPMVAAAPTCPTCPAPATVCPTCPAPVAVCPPACPTTSSTQTIIEVLNQTPQTSRLVAALQTGGLTKTLSGPGPFTLFAPTDAAFCKVDRCTLNGWADDPKTLTDALLYHVAYGKLMGCDLARLVSLGTIAGAPLQIAASADGVRVSVNGIGVPYTSVVASNGVIYFIDTMLTAPCNVTACANDIMTALAADPQYSMAVKMIHAAGMATELTQTAPVTFFAPTNAALSAIPGCTPAQLTSNPDKIRQYLLYAMVPGAYCVNTLRAMEQPFNTFLGVQLSPLCVGTGLKVNNIRVIACDIKACNGLIQGTSGVLMPPVVS